MKTFARVASALVAVSLSLSPLVAMADHRPADGAQAAARPADANPGVKKDHKKHEAAFPMKADQFRKHVDKRIEKVKARIEKAMEKHNVPAPKRAEIAKVVDSAIKDVHAAVDKAAADGVVTKEEAQAVKEVAQQVRAKVKAQIKDKHAKKGKVAQRRAKSPTTL